MADYVIDIETDGLDATKIHCMSVHGAATMTSYKHPGQYRPYYRP